jgi:hypothetical protein
MFRRKSLQGTGATTSAPTCARGKFRRRTTLYIELDDLLTMKLYLSRSDSGPKTLVLAVMKTHTNIHTVTFKYTRSLAAGTRRYEQGCVYHTCVMLCVASVPTPNGVQETHERTEALARVGLPRHRRPLSLPGAGAHRERQGFRLHCSRRWNRWRRQRFHHARQLKWIRTRMRDNACCTDDAARARCSRLRRGWQFNRLGCGACTPTWPASLPPAVLSWCAVPLLRMNGFGHNDWSVCVGHDDRR